MTISTVRFANLKALMEARQLDRKALAAKLGKEVGQVNHWWMRAGRPGKRGIGDKIAREIEAAFGVEHGWLDERHPPLGLQEHELMPEKDGTLVLREEPAEFPVRSGTQTIDVLDVHAAMTPPGGGLGIPDARARDGHRLDPRAE
jgi:hypothetical protein